MTSALFLLRHFSRLNEQYTRVWAVLFKRHLSRLNRQCAAFLKFWCRRSAAVLRRLSGSTYCAALKMFECLFESLNVCLNVYLKRALVWIMFKCVLDLSQSTWLSSSRFRPVTMISRDVYQLSGSWIQIQFVKHWDKWGVSWVRIKILSHLFPGQWGWFQPCWQTAHSRLPWKLSVQNICICTHVNPPWSSSFCLYFVFYVFVWMHFVPNN